jgi:hypothetical protein
LGKKKIGEKENSKGQEQKVEEGRVNGTKEKTTTMLTLFHRQTSSEFWSTHNSLS